MDPSPQDPIPSPPSPPQTTNTYHCLCTHLLLATTHTLSSLPRRKAPGLDNAFILPLPAPPTSTSSPPASPSQSRSRSRSASASSSSSSADDANANDNDPHPTDEQHSTHPTSHRPKRTRRPSKNGDDERDQGYSILLSATLDRKPVIVRREDGFEKRYLWRCGRCRLVVGYQIDEVHFLGKGGEMGREVEGEAGGRSGSVSGSKSVSGSGRRGKVVYLLPGGLVSTEEMKVGGRPVGDEGWV